MALIKPMNMSSIQKSLQVLTQGMKVQKERLLVISQNLSNAGNRAVSPDVHPYRRKMISFTSKLDKKTGVENVAVSSISRDPKPFERVYAPGEPGADKDGYVEVSNVNMFTEIADLQEGTRSHEANLKALERIFGMLHETISLLKA